MDIVSKVQGTGDDETPFDVKLEGVPLEGEGALLVVDDDAEGLLDAGPSDTKGDANGKQLFKLPAAGEAKRVPAWFPAAMVPKGMKFPRGIAAVFIRIRGEWTHARHKGDRFVILWELTNADEKLAIGRAMGDVNRASVEFTKQGVRVIDGHPVNWDGVPGPGSIDSFWVEIGAKGRNLLLRLHNQINFLDVDAVNDFFETSIAVVPTG